MIFSHEITLDIAINQIKTINIKQYTKDSLQLHVNLTNRGEPFQAAKQQLRCYFKMETPDKKHIFTDGIINENGSVDISIPEKASLTAGNGIAELVFVEADDETVFATMNLYINIVASSYQNDSITSSDDFAALYTALIAANKTYDNVMKSAQNSANAAKCSENNAHSSEINAKASETNAQASETNAANSALLSKSYTVGDTGLEERPHEDEDCAKYYCEQSNETARQAANSALLAQTQADKAAISETNAANSAALSKNYCEQAESISSGFSGALRPLGTVTFTNLPALETVTEGGMYNISDQFTTTDDFMEGSGLTIPAGSNIYKTAGGKWDVLAGSPVTGIKGNAENSYRKGNVNITPANIGSPTNEYINEHFVPDFVSIKYSNFSAGSSWRRVAEYKCDGTGGYNVNSFASCDISIKRGYNSPAPEFHKIQLIGSGSGIQFIRVADRGNILLKKIRLVWVAAELKYYLEVYYSGTYANPVTFTIENATGDIGHKCSWKTIAPVEVPETAAGSEILAEKDISGQFTLESLAKANGSNVSGTWANLTVGAATKATKDGDGNVIKSSYAVRKTISSGSFDNITTPGIYNVVGSNVTNQPDPSHGSYGLIVFLTYSSYIYTQLAFAMRTNNIYIRTGDKSGNFNTWTAWKQLYVEGNAKTKSDIVDLIYPIGSIYMSVNSTSPSTLFGGTWVRWGNGRVPVGVDTSQTEFNASGKTGGAKTHILTESELPKISGRASFGSGSPMSGSQMRGADGVFSPTGSCNVGNYTGLSSLVSYNMLNMSFGGNAAHNNLQPYITCYMWKRTA